MRLVRSITLYVKIVLHYFGTVVARLRIQRVRKPN
ncbi:hypothetical protein SBA6_80012 [Candidatus Sulfopaludibacter sp. SbA6]|nr:hypothetical protein SBA6_80012 [Candidatus Sulfopaludibacter sp. SbA6]